MSTLRSGATGNLIPCCWSDCTRNGRTRFQSVLTEPSGRMVNYLFCSDRHRLYYANSHIELGMLPAGTRGTDGHVSVA